MMEESKDAAKKRQIPRFARNDGGDNRDDAAEDARDDTVVDSIRNNNVMDSGLWRSGIGSSAGFDFANFFEAGAEAHFKTLIGGFVPGTAGQIVWKGTAVGRFYGALEKPTPDPVPAFRFRVIT